MKAVSHLFILLLSTLSQRTLAQLCQGSLGDPVVNITFGSGTGFGSPLSTSTTFYNYAATSCPNDGFYSIVNSTSSCFGSSWHDVLQDHTGNPGGFFMLVNASYQPGDFYIDTVYGLCPNTTFEFAAWIMNVLKSSACGGAGIRPNLTFYIETIDGKRLDSLYSGDIAVQGSPTWKQYGFYFKTPAGVNDVVIRIRNNAPGGCGNDLALDDITFRPCGPEVTASISGSSDVTELCEDNKDVYTLKAVVSQGYTDPSYQWQSSNNGTDWLDIPNATTPTYSRGPSGAGTYYYRIAVAETGNIGSPNCRVVSNTLTFHVYAKPVISANSNSPVCEGTTLSLTATGGNSYEWQGPGNYNGTGSNITINDVTATSAGKYYVKVISNGGCTQMDSVVVVVKPKPVANAGTDVDICEGSSVTLGGSGGGTYTWEPASGLSADNIPAPVASPHDSTNYILTVTDNNTGCSDNDTVAINVLQVPKANAGPDKTMMEGAATVLTGSAGGTRITIFWTPPLFISDPNALQPSVNPPHDTTYTLHVESTVGCGSALDEVFVKVFKKVIVPNAFSPNKDGINDTWQLTAIEVYPDADISVFNRYGQEVFMTHGYAKPWDGNFKGSPLPVGTYYYVIDLHYGLPLLKGWVAILR